MAIIPKIEAIALFFAPSDNLLVKLLDEQKIKYFRGNEKDILQRFLDSAKKFETVLGG